MTEEEIRSATTPVAPTTWESIQKNVAFLITFLAAMCAVGGLAINNSVTTATLTLRVDTLEKAQTADRATNATGFKEVLDKIQTLTSIASANQIDMALQKRDSAENSAQIKAIADRLEKR